MQLIRVNYYTKDGGYWGSDVFNEHDFNIMAPCVRVAKSQMERALGQEVITKTVKI